MGFSPTGGSISGADDVAFSNPTNTQVIAYNSAVSKWVNTTRSADAQLRDRATHTGTQAISTVVSLQSELDTREVLIRWNSSTNTWAPRPVAAAFGVVFLSTNDPDATAPTDANKQVGDVWRRHPDAS